MLAQEKHSRYVLRIVSQIGSMKKKKKLSPVTEEQRVKLLKEMGLLYTSNNQWLDFQSTLQLLSVTSGSRFLVRPRVTVVVNCCYFITAIRAVRYDDIYRMDEIKSLISYVLSFIS